MENEVDCKKTLEEINENLDKISEFIYGNGNERKSLIALLGQYDEKHKNAKRNLAFIWSVIGIMIIAIITVAVSI